MITRILTAIAVGCALSVSAQVHIFSPGGGSGSGGSATNVVLSGQVTKGAGSATTVINAAAIGSTNLALQSIDKTNLVNGTITSNQIASTTIDLSNFSQGATNWLLLVASNIAFTITKTATNTISANQLTNTLSQQVDTNIFSASAIAHLQSLFTNLVSTSAAGYAPKLPNDATKYLDGTGAYSVPAGGGGSAFPLSTDGNANSFGITNLSKLGGTNGSSITFGSPPGTVLTLTNSTAGGGYVLLIFTNGQAFIRSGITNGSFSSPGIVTNDASGKEYSVFPLPLGAEDLTYATNEVTRQVLNGTNNPAVVYAANNLPNGSAITTITNGGFSMNQYASTNVLISSGVLAASSQQTNYTIPLYNGPNGNMLRIYLANTNVWATLSGTNNQDWQRTICLDGVSNSVVSRIDFNVLGVVTNLNFVRFITNGTLKILNLYNLDTSGTNILVSDAGTYSHK